MGLVLSGVVLYFLVKLTNLCQKIQEVRIEFEKPFLEECCALIAYLKEKCRVLDWVQKQKRGL